MAEGRWRGHAGRGEVGDMQGGLDRVRWAIGQVS